MSDLEKLTKTLKEIGVEFVEEGLLELRDFTATERIIAYAGVGHTGLTCEFYFINGKLKEHGCWE